MFQNKFTDVSGIDSDSWKNRNGSPTRQTREHASTSWTNQSSSRRLFVFRLVSCQAKISPSSLLVECVRSSVKVRLIPQGSFIDKSKSNQIHFTCIDWVCRGHDATNKTANAFSFFFLFILCHQLDWIQRLYLFPISSKIGLNTCTDRRMIRLIEKNILI